MTNAFTLGDLRITAVSDGMATVPATVYYPGTSAEQWEPHKRWLDHDGNVNFPFACFLIQSGDKNVLIDTGLGSIPLFTFKGGELLTQLASAGVHPKDVDTVFVTHLHVDHCGTCVDRIDADPRPVFPNATYRWDRRRERLLAVGRRRGGEPGNHLPSLQDDRIAQ